MINFKNVQLTWRLRIARTGHNMSSFAKLLDITPNSMSDYCGGKKSISLNRFSRIETKLAELKEPFKMRYLDEEK